MPVHLPAIPRRRFLKGAFAAGTGLLLPRHSWAREPSADPNHFLLLADTHICHNRDLKHRGVKLVESMERVVREVLALPSRPVAGAIIAGDCAFSRGTSGDYATIRKVIEPLRRIGMPMHIALGNHDNRERFSAAFPEAKLDGPLMPGKYTSVLETPHVNWFLLDSLEVDSTTGQLGKAQLEWLAKSLDARPDKPALVMTHHNPEPLIKHHGLLDTEALFRVIMPRKQVKAYFYGHTHCWRVGQQAGIQLVNLPTAAYTFDPTQPRGFVTAKLRPDGAALVLHTLDPKHPNHGQKINLKWRA